MSMSAPTTSVPVPSPPRSARPLAARKQQNDPAWFSTTTTPVTSGKRQAVERVEGEPRNKRKRVGPTLQTTSQLGHRVDKLQERQNNESPVVSFVLLYCHIRALSRPITIYHQQGGIVGRSDVHLKIICGRWISQPCRSMRYIGISLSTTLFLRCTHHR
jgi:hypothetical protein